VNVVIVIGLFSSDNDELSKETKSSDVKVEEMFENDNNPVGPSTTSELVIIEQEEVLETSNEKKSDVIIEIPIVCTCLQAVLINHVYALIEILFFLSLLSVVRKSSFVKHKLCVGTRVSIKHIKMSVEYNSCGL